MMDEIAEYKAPLTDRDRRRGAAGLLSTVIHRADLSYSKGNLVVLTAATETSPPHRGTLKRPNRPAYRLRLGAGR